MHGVHECSVLIYPLPQHTVDNSEYALDEPERSCRSYSRAETEGHILKVVARQSQDDARLGICGWRRATAKIR
eukprot:scaffold27990_cov57-Attheya_sp.AAC.2